MQIVVFWKLDGAGNDFVALDNRSGRLPEGRARMELVRTLCARRTGVDADGAVILETPPDPSIADVRMRYHNCDGGETEMCGNGARCFASFAFHLGAVPAKGMRIETRAGVHRADVLGEESIRLCLPDISPLRHLGKVSTDGWSGEADFLTVGVPHGVIWMPDLESAPVNTLGRALRNHEAFAPAGANVNFGFLPSGEDPAGSPPAGTTSRVWVRTYERGVECETLACGTGSVATALSAVLANRARPPVAVRVRGGDDLIIDFDVTPEGGARRVTLTGPARILFRAETEWEPATGIVHLASK